jgi:hypothetical protein
MLEPQVAEHYVVAEVRRARDDAVAPPEIAERFQGRDFTMHELEERGVRITGRRGWYLANGTDWLLTLQAET